MSQISAISIPLLREYASLKQKKYRQKYNKFLVEGDKLVESLFGFDSWHPEALLLSSSAEVNTLLISKALSCGCKVWTLNSKQQHQLSAMVTPPDISAVVSIQGEGAVISEISGLWFILDGIKDPGNFGNILRIADWFGFSGIAFTDDCVDAYNPKVVQASMGSIFKTPFISGSREMLLNQFASFDWIGAKAGGLPLNEIVIKKDTAIVLGSESHGLSNLITDRIDRFGGIYGAQHRFAESLNVGNAAAIFAYQFARFK
jgi:TrmH family RNA methyltransferase